MKRARFFLPWAGAAGVLLVALALSALIRQASVENLVAVGEHDTVALTQAFANSLEAEFPAWVEHAATLPIDHLKAHPRVAALQGDARRQLRGTDVAKIKIYALNGRTVFSTEAAQIGESKASNAGFLAARAGGAATELTRREKFSAFDKVVENRNLLSAYLPFRDPRTGEVRLVFELYRDVTPLLEQINRTQIWVTGMLAAVLLTLFALLRGLGRATERQLQGRNVELQDTADRLLAAHAELERRVQERTAQVEQLQSAISASLATVRKTQEQRGEIVARLSSEVRAPLHVLVNAGERLASTSLDAHQRRQLDRIHEAGSELSRVLAARLEATAA